MTVEGTSGTMLSQAQSVLPGGGLGGWVAPADLGFVIQSGKAGRLLSTDGREYLDFVCGAGATIIGYQHPVVVDAVRNAVGRGLHFFNNPTEAAVNFASELVRVIPCAEKIAFSSTGSEATAYAMRIARAVTGRQKILKFEGAYHGNQDTALFAQFPKSAGDYPIAKADFGGVPNGLTGSMLAVPYNDLESVEGLLREQGADIAAIIVEPVQRVIFPQPGFLQGLRKLANEHGALLIFDEVVTGFRLALGGAQEYFGVVPDLACFGKIVGGGLPMGCVAGRADLLDCTQASRQGRSDYAYVTGATHGNPIAAAAGMATLNVLREPGFYERLHRRSDAFRSAFSQVLQEYEVPAVVAGAASFWQLVFSERLPQNQSDMHASDMKRSQAIDLALLDNGINVIPNARRFFSFEHTDEDLEFAVDRLSAACAAQYAGS